MLKEGDPVVFKNVRVVDTGRPTEFVGFGHVMSIHGSYVAIRYTHGSHVCFAVAEKKDVYPKDDESSEDPAVLQQANSMADAFVRSLRADEPVADVSDRLRGFMLRMHTIGYAEGQALSMGEPWVWGRELQRICASFIRFYDHRVEREGPPDKGAPEAEDLCDYLVWAMTALRDGLAVSPEVFDAVSVRAKAKATEASDEG